MVDRLYRVGIEGDCVDQGCFFESCSNGGLYESPLTKEIVEGEGVNDEDEHRDEDGVFGKYDGEF